MKFKHYKSNGQIDIIDTVTANQRMQNLSNQWEKESTPKGNLHMGVYDWAYQSTPNGIELKIPNLANGGSMPLNANASQDFGFSIYGDCFLEI